MNIPNTDYKLYKLPVNRKQVATSRLAQANVIVIDRSGSMGWTIGQLIKDIIGHILALPNGDVIAVYWFSSEGGRNGVILKNVQLTDDRTHIVTTLERYASTVGATCFSEVLGTVAQDLTDFGQMPIALTFFTDGYPVVYDRRVEGNRAVSTLESIAPRLNKALFIGYGHYNRELMIRMSQAAGGSLQHADDLREMRQWLARTATVDVSRKQTTSVNEDDICFTIASDGVSFASVSEGVAHHATDLWVLSKAEVVGGVSSNDETALYASAYITDALGKGDVALEILATLGDVHFIDQLGNAFTEEDYGRLDNALNEAVIDPLTRYQAGKDLNYLPNPDAYCALDLLADLQEGDNYLVLDDFKYKRIGRKSVPDPNAPKFERTPGQKVAFGDVVWNKVLLNMSVRTRQEGTVTLPDPKAAKKLGLPSKVPTSVWRTYSLVANGKMNVAKLPVTVDKDTWRVLKENGLVTGRYVNGKVYELDLQSLPVINRSMAAKTSAKQLAEWQYELLTLGAEAKVLKELRKRYFGVVQSTEGLEQRYGTAAANYLAQHGITDKGFSSGSKQADPVDVIEVNSMEIKVQGYASLPKVSDVEAKVEAIKEAKSKGEKYQELTGRNAMLATALEVVEQATDGLSGDELKAKYTALLGLVNKRKVKVAANIAQQKFAMLLTNQWFGEFSNRQEKTWVHEGVKITFEVPTEPKQIKI